MLIMFTSAARLINSSATSNWPLIVAINSGVVLSPLVTSLMFAPPSSNAIVAARFPCRVA